MKLQIGDSIITSTSLGYGNVAWKITDCTTILNLMKENGIYVLGGDVLNLQRRYIYAMWTYQRDQSLSYEENARLSADKAIEYITWFMSKIGNEYLIAIVIDKKSKDQWPPKR